MRCRVAALAALLLVACACTGSRSQPIGAEPAVLDLSAIPELEVPIGYALSRSDDQVAVQVPGAGVRYAVLVLQGDPENPELLRGTELSDWFDRHWTAYGWERTGPWSWRHRQRREALRLETGRRRKLPIIRLLLRHLPPS